MSHTHVYNYYIILTGLSDILISIQLSYSCYYDSIIILSLLFGFMWLLFITFISELTQCYYWNSITELIAGLYNKISHYRTKFNLVQSETSALIVIPDAILWIPSYGTTSLEKFLCDTVSVVVCFWWLPCRKTVITHNWRSQSLPL